MKKKRFVPLEERQKQAENLLNTFSAYTEYKHGKDNPYRNWLDKNPKLTIAQVVDFLNFWFVVSYVQPRILLTVAAAYPEWHDRKLIMQNYIEEDGMAKEGHVPHYDLLKDLIEKMGGKVQMNPVAIEMMDQFHRTLSSMTPAEATGVVAAIEHPALDISYYFNKIIGLCGHTALLKLDIYLLIHIDVEPDHIIWTHGNALEHMQNARERDEILSSFTGAMSFWEKFWALAFERLGYAA